MALLININFCSITQRFTFSLVTMESGLGKMAVHSSKLYKRFTSLHLLFGPTFSCDETSKYSPVFLRPSHLASGGQQSSIFLPLPSWTILLA